MVVKSQLCTLLVSSTLMMHSHICNANVEHDLAGQRSSAIEQGKALLTDDYITSLISKSESIQRQQFSEEPYSEPQEITYKILISDSMGKQEIRNLLWHYKHRSDVSFVVRGLLGSERTITDVSRRIVSLVSDFEMIPNVSLDPRPFKEVEAEYAPQLLAYRGNTLIASAKGITNIAWLSEQISSGKGGYLGDFGTTYKIAERDFEEVLKERVAAIDKQKLMEGAKERFWDNVQYLQLPKAQVSQVRTFVPEIVLNEDIVTQDGYVIGLKGQRFNTLSRMPFTQRVVVFDATDKHQLEFVKNLTVSDLRTKYITTKFDSSLKWDAIKTVENELNAPVFQLNSDIINAFDVRVIPSIVTANNQDDFFYIEEVMLDAIGGVQ